MRKQPVTMLELLLVMALIALSLGVLGIQIPKLLQSESFERSVDQVKSRLMLAQEIMLDYRTDVTFVFKPTSEGVECQILADKPLSERVKSQVARHALVKGIEKVEPAELYFDGTLGVTPNEKLILRGNKREATLTLKGHPSHIRRGDHEAKKSTTPAYPEAALSFI